MPKVIKSTKKYKTVYAFIDSQNLNLGVRSQGWKLDFALFRRYLKDKYGVKKALLFIGMVTGNEVLYKYLQECGYILIFKPTLEIKDTDGVKTKGNVNAELVLHTMIEFGNYDKAIIVSGDGDFHCLVEYLAIKNKLLKIVVPNRYYSRLLKKFNSYIFRVDLLRSSLEQKKQKTKINNRSKP